MRNRLISISDKMSLYYLSLTIIVLSAIGAGFYYASRSAYLESAFDRLTALRNVKKREAENYFAAGLKDAELFAQTPDLLGNTNFGFEVIEELIKADPNYEVAYEIFFDSMNVSVLPLGGNISGEIEVNDELLNRFLSAVVASNRPIASDVPLFGEDKILFGAPTDEGVLILQSSYENINRLMLENDPKSGLGESGETYLVGDDFKMRSESRFHKNSIKSVKVSTKGARRALTGESGVSVFEDYRGVEVLSSYAKLDAPGIDWAILAELDMKEAFSPFSRIFSLYIFISAVAAVVVLILTLLISKRIAEPIKKLTSAVSSFGDGEFLPQENFKTRDEISQLAESFNKMATKLIQKNKQIEREREGRRTAVIEALDGERERLAGELHDGLGQSLIALKYRLELVDDSDPDEAESIVGAVKDGLDAAVDDLRNMSNNLAPSALSAFGLVSALERMIRDIDQIIAAELSVDPSAKPDGLSKRDQLHVFRILQESLTNTLKHSGAESVIVEILSLGENGIEFRAIDDGKGFDPETAKEGRGLHFIRERVFLLKGELDISSSNNGTMISVKLKKLHTNGNSEHDK